MLGYIVLSGEIEGGHWMKYGGVVWLEREANVAAREKHLLYYKFV